jgi:hypothetical protein
MTVTEFLSPQEIQTLFDLPAVATALADGSFRFEKAGVVGIGPTTTAARDEWGRKFAEMIARPKNAAT